MTLPTNTFTTWLKDPHLGDWWHAHTLFLYTPPADWPLMWAYVGFTAACWILGIALAFLKIHANLKTTLARFLWANALIGPLLWFFRYERLPLMGMDIWRLIQFICDVVWIVLIIRYIRTTHRKTKVKEQVTAYKNRFLPTQK
jgi:hypothetical protein